MGREMARPPFTFLHIERLRITILHADRLAVVNDCCATLRDQGGVEMLPIDSFIGIDVLP